MNKFECMYFEVKDVEESIKIQKHLFTLGYSWDPCELGKIQNTHATFIFTELDGRLMHAGCMDPDWLNTYKCKQLVVDVKIVDRVCPVVSLNGHTFSVEAVEKALKLYYANNQ